MAIDWAALPASGELGRRMHALMAEVFQLPRSRTGDGVRATLAALGRELPIEVVEVPTGTPLFDWEAPEEWNVRAAWIEAPDGRRVVDLADSTLHVVGYSLPVDAEMTLAELRPHLRSDPERPDAIPYHVAYGGTSWGFCLTHRALEQLREGTYRVRIDATLAPGSLTYGEAVLPGTSEDEILLTASICHPALANDNLSGDVLLWAVGLVLARQTPLRHTVRLVWSPGTLGPLAWLARNEPRLDRVRHGVVVSCAGDPGPLRYKRSRLGRAEIDRIAAEVLRHHPGSVVEDWHPWGGDERQLCAPGFDLPVGTLSRSNHGTYPEYHSSDDDLELVTPEALEGSLRALLELLDAADANAYATSLAPYGEPRLGARGLYPGASPEEEQKHLFWVLSLADGAHTLLDVAAASGVPFRSIHAAARRLEEHGLVRLGPEPGTLQGR